MDEYVRITIPNWKKFQPNLGKQKSCHWFSIINTIWTHEIWDLPARDIKLFVTVLCLVSMRGFKTGEVTISVSTLAKMAKLKPSWIRVGLVSIQQRNTIVCEFGDLAIVKDDFARKRVPRIERERDKRERIEETDFEIKRRSMLDELKKKLDGDGPGS